MFGRSLSLILVLSACGARTDLEVVRSEHPADATGIADTGVDVSPPECRRDRDCDDGIDCTRDSCRRGACGHRPRDGRCELRSICNVGRCDITEGCVSEPIPCDDGVACTVDACGEEFGCQSVADNGRCPISHRCDPMRGCIARALIHDSDALYEVDLPSGDFRRLTSTGPRLTDIALAPDRQLYGVNFDALYALDETDSLATLIHPSTERWVALEVGPDNTLLAAGQDQRVVSIDIGTGRTTVIARLPAGWVAAGDIAFVEGRMLITVTDVPSSETAINQLAEIDLGTGETVLLGPTGYPCIWALAAFGETLYGFTCHGQLLRIDPFSGASEVLRSLPMRVGGAAAR